MNAETVLELARRKGVMIATAESCTGGLIVGALTEIAGSSDVVDRGFVTYSNAAKMEMIGVRAETLERFGAVSEETAAEMAAGARKHSRAGLTVSVTGVAGPGGGSPEKPVGRVCFGISDAQGTRTELVDFGDLGRAGIRAATVAHALDLLALALTEQ
ncbi:CinA family protein [Paracoccus aminophilus]|uniref:Competence/damage-inducible protein CinA n=1 Tax=Paracoccus aminophilus JCM 7686 TaxID=1367847 RepID=S5XYH6_PARAH|nr:CinA family protein [Paracoccus aminophilus]AGT08485.1 competence/damage-inducible protein CinA [Paracoccus aminophilus JCM 7686]